MSATTRTKHERTASADYYATPLPHIRDFLNAWGYGNHDAAILDPCAGGDPTRVMAYPTVLAEMGFRTIDTIDKRADSLAKAHGNYLEMDCAGKYDLIISNPPFNIALDFISKALADVRDGGHVAMLLRHGFLATKTRKPWMLAHTPEIIFLHSSRPRFHGMKGTDSWDYIHAVWRKGYYPVRSEHQII